MRTEREKQQLLDAILGTDSEWANAALGTVRRGACRRRYTRYAKRGVLAALAISAMIALMLPRENPPTFPANVGNSASVLQVVRSVPLPPELVVRSTAADLSVVRTGSPGIQLVRTESQSAVRQIDDEELLRLAPHGAILVRYENQAAELIGIEAAVR